MEQQQRSLIFTAAVGLIILAIIVGSIYYLVKFIQGRVASNSQSPQPSVTEIAEDFAVSPQASAQMPQTGNSDSVTNEQNQSADKKVYNAGNFQLAYPKNWGIITCTNSKNIELDPVNPADENINCDIATRAVTVLVSDIRGCEGQVAKIGNVDVVKTQETDSGETYYKWCTKTTPVLNITHRVSPQNKRGFSTQDFSRPIEEMIANLSFSRGS